MKEKTLKFLAPILLVLGFLTYLTFFTVSEVQQAIILQFGDPKRVIKKAGLNYKIPLIQNVVFRYKNLKFRRTTRRSYCI